MAVEQRGLSPLQRLKDLFSNKKITATRQEEFIAYAPLDENEGIRPNILNKRRVQEDLAQRLHEKNRDTAYQAPVELTETIQAAREVFMQAHRLHYYQISMLADLRGDETSLLCLSAYQHAWAKLNTKDIDGSDWSDAAKAVHDTFETLRTVVEVQGSPHAKEVIGKLEQTNLPTPAVSKSNRPA